MAEPTMLFWNGITPSAKSDNLEKALKVEVRDPLWMLCRQWQLGEFIGEDAAMPTFARIKYHKNFPVWRKEGKVEKETADNQQPLNAWVEASPFTLDLTMKIEIGQHWIRMLQANLTQDKTSIIEQFKETEKLQFDLPKADTDEQRIKNADLLSNDPLINMMISARNLKSIDGEKLLTAIISTPSLSKHIFPTQKINSEIDSLGKQLLDWIKRVYNFQIEESKTWQKSRMEYQFDLCANEKQDKQQCLVAEEYWGGKMDWYQFDFKEEPTPLADAPPSDYKEVVYIPSQVNYVGMPKTRWWEMEDSTVNFGNIKTTTDNPTRLLFAHFNMVYGNDWFLLPLTVETGSLTSVEEIIVNDNFGFRTKIKPTPKDSNDLWNFFNFQNLEQSEENSNWFYFPNTVSGVQKSAPIEQVDFIRDEMANMVWAIESRITNQVDESIKGGDHAKAVRQYLAEFVKTEAPENLPNQAEIKYQIASLPPENWTPFVPVQLKNQNLTSRQIQLQRASMPRIINGYKPSRIRPKTALLAQGLKTGKREPLYIFEEEIPRAGCIVKGQWKRTRWLNGKTVTWYSYEKTNGRGEGNSGLKFDQVINKDQ